MSESPVLYLGIDLGVRGDTSALAAVYEHEDGHILEYGHRIWTPPVSITYQVKPLLMTLLTHYRVGGVAYDWWQFESTREGIVAEGHQSRLQELNQQTENPAFTSLLRTLFYDKQIGIIDDGEAILHLERTATRETERGPRIEKLKQTQKIDYTLALGMATLIASRDLGHLTHPTFTSTKHTRSALLLP